MKTFATYSKDLEDNSNFMFNIYNYSDNTDNYTSRNRRDPTFHDKFKKEEWIQNGLKSEYRKSYDSFAFMTGVDVQRNTVETLTFDTDATKVVGALSGSSDTDENINAVYAELKNQWLPSLSSTLNARYDNISYDYEDNLNSTYNVNPSYDVGSFRAGLNYSLNSNNNIYVSVSSGFKVPTASQISTNQEGVSLGKIASGDLHEEITYNYEIGITGKEFGLNYNASIYQLDRQDYIGLIGGSYTRSSSADEDIYYDNLGDIRSRGFELALNSNKEKVLSFDMAYTYLNAVFKDYYVTQVIADNTFPTPDVYQKTDFSGNEVPRTSKHTLSLILNYKPISSLTISPQLIAKSSYYADEANKFKQDGYEVVNLRASYELNPQLEIFAKIDNLLDETYYEFVNVSSSSIFNTMDDATIRVAPGRATYVGLRMVF